MEHYIKIEAKYYERVIARQKLFEVRLNDRDYQVGDTLRYEVINPLCDGRSFGNDPTYEIKYIHSGLGMADNYIVMQIEEMRMNILPEPPNK